MDHKPIEKVCSSENPETFFPQLDLTMKTSDLQRFFFMSPLESCLDKLCGDNEECVEDSNGNPKCICKLCSDEPSEEVCGSDGITYFSLCHLQRASCTQKQSDLYAHHYGPCGEIMQKSLGMFP